jgi:hypothetical protein
MPSDVRDSIERGWREVAAIDEALERGEIDEEGWHAAVAEIIVPAYLSAETPWEQSGKSGDLAGWSAAAVRSWPPSTATGRSSTSAARTAS